MKIIVAGAGDVGEFLASKYCHQHDVIVVDIEQKKLERVEKYSDVMTYKGNITHLPVMKKIQVSDCDVFLAVTGSDEVNILSATLAQRMGAQYTVARVDSPNFYLDFNKGIVKGELGINSMVCSSRLIAHELHRKYRKLIVPHVQNYSENNVTVFTYKVTSTFEHLEKKLSDIDLGSDGKIGAVIRDGILQTVGSVTSVYEGDQILVSAHSEKFLPCMQSIDSSYGRQKLVVIGGDEIGQSLAKNLSKEGHETLIFENDEMESEFLSEKLEKVQVVHASGTDVSVLKDQRIETAKALFSVTKADEINLMSSLVAKNIGVKYSFALVHDPTYSQIYRTLGVNDTTNASELIFEAVNYLTGENLITHEHTVENSNANIYEIYIPDDEPLKLKSLFELNLPDSIIYLNSYIESKVLFGANPKLVSGSYYVFASSLSKENFLSYFKKV